ncbi:MAG: hypothetical protein GTO03_07450, partial [Planctomycetales bacterium]|nr:hypothetical protein [Planctomycetales bacterium]
MSDSQSNFEEAGGSPPQAGRRGLLAVLVGGLVAVAPFLLGLTVFLDP